MLNWIRRLFCKHEFEEVARIEDLDLELLSCNVEAIKNIRVSYICKKCGYIRNIKL